MTTPRMIEFAAAVLILVVSIWLYRRPKGPDGYGSQGAVVLLVVALIMGIHALGGLNYHPTPSELDYMKARAQ